MQGKSKTALARERLRRRYRPNRVRVLFVGEAPPASGRFFYQADSGLYRAMRGVFVESLPDVTEDNFLATFKKLGCYLVDLCGIPVDRLSPSQRRQACRDGEPRLAAKLRTLKPEVIVTLVRSIEPNLGRSIEFADWIGEYLKLPYPGRWHHHRAVFVRRIKPMLRKTFAN